MPVQNCFRLGRGHMLPQLWLKWAKTECLKSQIQGTLGSNGEAMRAAGGASGPETRGPEVSESSRPRPSTLSETIQDDWASKGQTRSTTPSPVEQVADRYPLPHSFTVRPASGAPLAGVGSQLVIVVILHTKRVNKAQQQLLEAITSLPPHFPGVSHVLQRRAALTPQNAMLYRGTSCGLPRRSSAGMILVLNTWAPQPRTSLSWPPSNTCSASPGRLMCGKPFCGTSRYGSVKYIPRAHPWASYPCTPLS